MEEDVNPPQDPSPAIPEDDTTEAPPAAPAGRRNLFIGLGLGLAIALVGPRLIGGNSSTANDAPDIAAAPVAAQTVSVAPARQGSVAETLTVTGTVQAADLLIVTPQVSGLQIRQVLVDVGDAVGVGQPLVIFDDATLRAQIQQAQAQVDVAIAQVEQQRANLAQAEATLAEAEANLGRYQSLQDQGAVSAEELDSRSTQTITARENVRVADAAVASAEATVRSRQADVDRLQTQLDYTVLRAPSSGIVAERLGSVGDVSSTSNEVLTLIQGNQLELAVTVPQAQLPQVTVGAPATITASTDASVQLEGAVQEIEPLVDPQTRTAQVIIRVPASERVRSGMFLNAAIQVGRRSGVTVPASAVLPQPDGSMQVWVLSPENTALARAVETGTRLPESVTGPARIEILEGLQPGEQVIVAGASYVQAGDSVTVSEDL
ncbi:MAG: efflux RND transporter periplasmic adaptor subunit [Leptolyngbyaceae cyanobacterium]